MLQNESDNLALKNDVAEQLIELPINTSAVDATLQQLYTEYSEYQEEEPFTSSNPASNQISADGEKTVVRNRIRFPRFICQIKFCGRIFAN